MAKGKLISALDVGTSKITTLIAQLRDPDSDSLHIVGVASVPAKGIRKGQIVNIEEAIVAITESIEAAERMAGFNIAKVWASVGGSHITSQNSHGVVAVSEPQGEINSQDVRRVLEAARAISLPAASEIIHVIPRSFNVDSQEGVKDPTGMTGVRLEVTTHIVTGSSTSLKNLVKCVSEVGCDIAGLVYTGLASGLAVLTDTEQELGVILIDIGGGTTSIAMFTEGALSYSSVLPVGAKNVTNDLAIGLRISLESAEKIKLFFSTLKTKEDDIDLSSLHLPEELKTVSAKTLVEGIIRPRLNEIFQLVASEIKKSNLGGLTPAGLVITGGGALTVGISDSAKRVLSMPVRVASPTGISGLIDDIENPAFAAPVGLLKYSVSESAEPLHQPGHKMPSLPNFGKLKIISFLKSLLP
ncbi:cell division protein FtsA [Candidatus Amesbacteria bacterium]|nr:cell division protein FtsA [Candidatus Amesbacteria bacterium]